MVDSSGREWKKKLIQQVQTIFHHTVEPMFCGHWIGWLPVFWEKKSWWRPSLTWKYQCNYILHISGYEYHHMEGRTLEDWPGAQSSSSQLQILQSCCWVSYHWWQMGGSRGCTHRRYCVRWTQTGRGTASHGSVWLDARCDSRCDTQIWSHSRLWR